MAEINRTETFATLTEIEERVTQIEAKVKQAETAYHNFLRSAEDNPILRMALSKFGLSNDGTNT